jgi:hypothetical protein
VRSLKQAGEHIQHDSVTAVACHIYKCHDLAAMQSVHDNEEFK